jgi:hypothetical protein
LFNGDDDERTRGGEVREMKGFVQIRDITSVPKAPQQTTFGDFPTQAKNA